MLEGKATNVSLFLALPTEIRLRIYQYVFDGVKVFSHRAGYFPAASKLTLGVTFSTPAVHATTRVLNNSGLVRRRHGL
jgi:hypothetical protein